jgi:hypothetical protein
VRFVGVAFALMSLVLLGVDGASGMPWWWSASKGQEERCSGRCCSCWPAPLIGPASRTLTLSVEQDRVIALQPVKKRRIGIDIYL